MSPSVTLKRSIQGGGSQVNSSSGVSGPCVEVRGDFSNRDLYHTSGKVGIQD